MRRLRSLGWRHGLSILVVLGLIAAVVVAVNAVRDERQALPGPGTAVIAWTLCCAWLVVLGLSWMAMFPRGPSSRRILSAAWVSQLAKYLLIGGIAQAAGQIALGRDERTSVAEGSARYAVWMLASVAAALTLGLPFAFVSDLPVAVRVAAGLGTLCVLLLRRRWLAGLLDLTRRASIRIPAGATLPSQAALVRVYLLALASFVLWGAAFAVLLHDVAPDVAPPVAVAAFGLAWVVGLLVVPVPAGAGIREAVLVGLLASVAPAPEVLLAAVGHRVLTILAEIVVVLADRLVLLVRRRPGWTGRA